LGRIRIPLVASYLHGVSDETLSAATIGAAFDRALDEFRMTITGNVQKFKMREQTVETLGLETSA
jgi:hypothetical protein